MPRDYKGSLGDASTIYAMDMNKNLQFHFYAKSFCLSSFRENAW